MPDLTPYVAPSRRVLTLQDEPDILPGSGRYYATGPGGLWVWTPRRMRRYICSLGIEHKFYWRLHANGRTIELACDEHEVQHKQRSQR